MGTKAVFFDRDGTLNEDVGYLHKMEDFRWCKGAIDAIRYCNEKGYLVIVITNQSGVARGYFPEEEVRYLHAWMNGELIQMNAHIDSFYYCPHYEGGTVAEYAKKCGCRKPATGMIDAACEAFGIDRTKSILVGDKESDMECAKNAHIKGVHYQGGNLLKAVKQGLGVL